MMKSLGAWRSIGALAFAVAACGDKIDPAQKNLEAQKAIQTATKKEKQRVEGMQKGYRKYGKIECQSSKGLPKNKKDLLLSKLNRWNGSNYWNGYCGALGEIGLSSNTTRSSSGGESRSVRMWRRSVSSVTCFALQENRWPLTSNSTSGFFSKFWHQCLPLTLLDDA
jgi:hypothetical protein